MNPAALVYLISGKFGGSGVAQKGGMVAHRALPGFL
jgi:hypothetical protein